MKILYAAGRSSSSKYQLQRFADHVPQQHNVKFAAYRSSSPLNLSIDFTLDFLLNPVKKSLNFFDNENFSIYFDVVRRFNPDLIISDLEQFTSAVADELNIRIIQCSSNMLTHALTSTEMYALGIHSKYHGLFADNNEASNIQNIVLNSDDNYVYSHFGDIDFPPKLKDGFKWISPYHQVGKKSAICHHEVIGISDSNNASVINYLDSFQDAVLFNNDIAFDYENIKVKNIENQKEYYCNLKNSDIVVCDANSTFLADAFYNGKFPLFSMNFLEKDSVINGLASLKLKTAFDVQDALDGRDVDRFERQEHVRKNLFLHEIL